MTKESILLGYTLDAVYAVDARSLKDRTLAELRYPLATPRLIKLGTYLGKWVARCTRGDENEALIQGIREPRGFLKHVLEVDVTTRQTPLLTEGGVSLPLDDSNRVRIPQNWRRRW